MQMHGIKKFCNQDACKITDSGSHAPAEQWFYPVKRNQIPCTFNPAFFITVISNQINDNCCSHIGRKYPQSPVGQHPRHQIRFLVIGLPEYKPHIVVQIIHRGENPQNQKFRHSIHAKSISQISDDITCPTGKCKCYIVNRQKVHRKCKQLSGKHDTKTHRCIKEKSNSHNT